MNENHRRSISSSLKVIERLVHEIETCLLTPVNGTMFRHIPDVQEEEKQTLLETLGEIRSFITCLSTRYSLATETLSVNWMIEINKTKMWEVLSDTSFKRLKNYGDLSESEGAELDHYILQLQNMVSKL